MALDKTGTRIYNSLRNKLGPAISSEWAVYVQGLGDDSKLERLLLKTVALLPEKSAKEISNFSDSEIDKGIQRRGVNKFFGVSGE